MSLLIIELNVVDAIFNQLFYCSVRLQCETIDFTNFQWKKHTFLFSIEYKVLSFSSQYHNLRTFRFYSKPSQTPSSFDLYFQHLLSASQSMRFFFCAGLFVYVYFSIIDVNWSNWRECTQILIISSACCELKELNVSLTIWHIYVPVVH